MGMFDVLNEEDDFLNEEDLETLNEEEEKTEKDNKEEKKCDKCGKSPCECKEDDDEDKGKKKDKNDDKDDDDDDDDDEDMDDEIKDEEVIDSFILNEAAEEDLIKLENAQGVNFKNEKKIKWVTKEQKLKRLTYKISILMAKKNNDTDYKKWAKGRAIVVAARKKIMLKYKARALSRARKVIAAYRAGKFAGLLQDKKDIAQPKGIQKT